MDHKINARLYGILVLLTAGKILWIGYTVQGYGLLALFLIVYYGESILYKIHELKEINNVINDC